MKISLWCCQAQTLSDGASNPDIEYVAEASAILNIIGYQNYIFGSNLMAILRNGRILPIGGVASGRV